MFTYPNINPIALQIGPLKIYWYGLMYVIGFSLAWFLGKRQTRLHHSPISEKQLDDLIFFLGLGVILGGRLGYVLFYQPMKYLADPFSIFYTWKGGMSFHGGLLGVLLVSWWLKRRWSLTFLALSDFIVPLVPLGLLTGRIGNFINGELWGRITNVPWGVVFPNAGWFPRHPSQLYESLLEGLLLFLILWPLSQKPRPVGLLTGIFLFGYGCIRFLIEFVREPDPQYGFIAWDWMTMGQLLSIPLIAFGIFLLYYSQIQQAAHKT